MIFLPLPPLPHKPHLHLKKSNHLPNLHQPKPLLSLFPLSSLTSIPLNAIKSGIEPNYFSYSFLPKADSFARTDAVLLQWNAP